MKTYYEINTVLGNILPRSITQVGLYAIDENVVSSDFVLLLKRCYLLMFDSKWTECAINTDRLLDLTWEKLNTGHWKDVSCSWNLAYSYLSLVLSICKLCSSEEGGIMTSSILEAVQICDKGILMGAPVLDNILPRLITILSKVDRERREKIGATCASKNTESNAESGENDYRTNKRQPESEKADVTSYKIQRTTQRPDIPVEYVIPVIDCPSLELFKSEYMDSKAPVVIKDAVSYWPAMNDRKWTIEYLKEVAGCRTVPIELGSKYTETSWSQKLMTVKEFIEKYVEVGESEIGYLAQHQLFNQIPELERDISVPTYCCLGNEEEVDINAWFGPQGTISPLHQDPKHNFLVQVFGEKYIVLYEEKFTENVYPHPEGLLTNTSQVDVENPDFEKFPLLKDTPYIATILKPGDMLYIPPKCWHYVRSLSVSFSVSFWWE